MSMDKKNLPEITLKAIFLSIVLTVVLAGANAYLGLKVGLTISASIPAAVISMACLRFFREHNVLENNIVQTAASAGEALTAGIVFTVPALIVISFWQTFQYTQIVVIAILGGVLGVLFSVPLRRVLLADKSLPFPEGTAIGNVLKASSVAGFGAKNLMMGGAVGALIQIFQLGFKILSETAQYWFFKGKLVFGLGIGFSPALIGAGYIIGIHISLCILLGIIIGWVIGIPLAAWVYGLPEAESAYQVSIILWDNYIRYLGLGVMMVGGLWAILVLLKPILKGMSHSIESLAISRMKGLSALPREEQDLPINWVCWSILLVMVLIFLVLRHMSHAEIFEFSPSSRWLFDGVNFFYILIGGFIFSSICAYFAGLVGSSANPLSSISLIALMFSALIVLWFLGDSLQEDSSGQLAMMASGVVIIVTAFMAASAGISNDTIQDLKTGQFLGATPWKQQVMLIVGVFVSALIIPLVLDLLFNAYGMAGVFPHANMDPEQMLLAPQASLMAAIVRGVFMSEMKTALLIAGAIIAVMVLILDKWLQRYTYRVPVLAVGLGIYLPVSTSSPLVIGGMLAWWIKRLSRKITDHLQDTEAVERQATMFHHGLLIASGLVSGAAVIGVLLAIPFVLQGTSDALRLMPKSFEYSPQYLSLLVTGCLFFWFKHRVLT